jgi:hypothetical protein
VKNPGTVKTPNCERPLWGSFGGRSLAAAHGSMRGNCPVDSSASHSHQSRMMGNLGRPAALRERYRESTLGAETLGHRVVRHYRRRKDCERYLEREWRCAFLHYCRWNDQASACPLAALVH